MMFFRLTAILLSLLPTCVVAQTYEQCIEQAYHAVQHDSLQKAEALFRQALKISNGDRRNALVHHDLGHVQELLYWENENDSKMGEEAMYNYSKAIELQPNSSAMRLSRGNFHLNLKHYEKAVDDYTAILKQDGTNIGALNYRAFAYYQNRNYERAMNDYKTILERRPSDYNAALGMALVLQKTYKVSEAIRRMEFLIVEHPDKAELYAVRASMYSDINNLDLALFDINKAVELEPSNPKHYLQRADIYEKQGKHQQAKADRKKARQ